MQCLLKPYEEVEKISLLDICCHTGSHFSHYTINNDKSPLICQTPWLYLYSTPRYIIKNMNKIYFLTLLFWNTNSDLHQQKWVDFITVIQKSLFKWIKYKQKSNKITWLDCLEKYNDKIVWKLSDTLCNVKCFDTTKNITDIKHLNSQDYVRLAIHFSHIWYNNKTQTAGIGFKILQIQHNQVKPPIEIIFKDIQPVKEKNSHVSTKLLSTERTKHPVFGKYFKMIQVGIPKSAIKQKMKMNNLDPNVLDIPENNELPNISTNDEDQLKLSLKEEKTLRKTEPIVKKYTKNQGKSHGISLQQIVNGLNKLRKSSFYKKKVSKQEKCEHSSKELPCSKQLVSNNHSKNEVLLQLLQSKYSNI